MGVSRVAISGGGMLLAAGPFGPLLQYNATAHLIWRLRAWATPEEIAALLAARHQMDKLSVLEEIRGLEKLWQRQFSESGSHESIGPDQRKPDSTSDTLSVNVEGTSISLTGPKHILARFGMLWSNRITQSLRHELDCRLVPTTGDSGSLVINGAIEVENAPWQEILGGLNQVILQHFNPGLEFAAIIHGAAVSRNGKAVILAAASGSGKSTLTAQLVASGYKYLSDDIVALAKPSMDVAAFPTAVSVKPGAVSVLSGLFPGQLDPALKTEQYLRIANASFKDKPTPAKSLVFPRFVAGAEVEYVPMTVETALARLLSDRIFFGYPLQMRNIQNFAIWLKTVEIRELIYSNFQMAEKCIRQTLN